MCGVKTRDVVVLVLLVATVLTGATRLARGGRDAYAFTASSARPGFAAAGRLGDLGPHDLIVYTKTEPEPSVRIDLLETRRVRRIVLAEGVGCCELRRESALVELAGDDEAFVEVARLAPGVDLLDHRFTPREARFVRIRGAGAGSLHFQAIDIR
jgi:hypothetical protein